MRISDWSSDVCSSDLLDRVRDAVRLNLNILPVDIIGGDIGDEIAAEPAALQPQLVIGDAVRLRAVGDDQVVLVDRADQPGTRVDDGGEEPRRYGRIGGQAVDRLPRARKSTRLNSSP